MKTFEKIYHVVSKIPKGKIMTYAQVAHEVGITNPRVVGFAMRINKDTQKVPCHRVVGSDGKLRGYAFGGISHKKEILEQEGVTFLDAHTVNISKHTFTV